MFFAVVLSFLGSGNQEFFERLAFRLELIWVSICFHPSSNGAQLPGETWWLSLPQQSFQPLPGQNEGPWRMATKCLQMDPKMLSKLHSIIIIYRSCHHMPCIGGCQQFTQRALNHSEPQLIYLTHRSWGPNGPAVKQVVSQKEWNSSRWWIQILHPYKQHQIATIYA